VFAAGDVRSGSVKRVASAVGEGAMAVQLVHAHLDGRPQPSNSHPRQGADR
jgi:thioredoxin reductase (NADPH)